MTLRRLEAIVPMVGADDRHMDFLHHIPHHGFMTVRAQPIQNHAGDMGIPVIFPKSQSRGSDTVAHGLAVQHKDNRRFEPFGNIR